MEVQEAKYLMLKDKIKNLSDQLKDLRKVLNDTASVLLNSSDRYEFETENLVLTRPTSHKIMKKPKDGG